MMAVKKKAAAKAPGLVGDQLKVEQLGVLIGEMMVKQDRMLESVRDTMKDLCRLIVHRREDARPGDCEPHHEADTSGPVETGRGEWMPIPGKSRNIDRDHGHGSGCNTSAAPMAVRARCVPDAIDELYGQVAETQELLTRLHERLEPVLRQGSTACESWAYRTENPVPLGNAVGQNAERVALIRAGIMDLLERLEV